ncbi:MAG TPA: tRNA 2-thiouridine(34) synthase MnmA [Steroidobacteraceae bacterium]|nr:tRNA 2-thiouridine(34) synthase MnmA [Steroidobacteraceae bacterium]
MSEPVIVGLSGGVDSAVAALLLLEQGYEVQGLFMSNWDEEDAYCTQAQDFQDARAVARVLGIPLHRANFAADYRARVFEYFLAEHRAGRTPNPDVLCNREVKFGVALRHARRLGARYFATGHYARLRHDSGRVQLLKALDPNKDQTYFLHAVHPDDLQQALLPVGDYTKAQVRERARAAGLPVFDKPDSTGICFIGERPFREFLRRYLPESPGRIESPTGELLGRHGGLAFHTIGQRGGLGLGGRRDGEATPWYVAAKDHARNVLIAVQGHDHPLLYARELQCDTLHWLVRPDRASLRCTVRVRHRHADQPAVLQVEADRARVIFDEPQRALTPGQFAVAYAGDLCLGGGIIRQVDSGAGPVRARLETQPAREQQLVQVAGGG